MFITIEFCHVLCLLYSLLFNNHRLNRITFCQLFSSLCNVPLITFATIFSTCKSFSWFLYDVQGFAKSGEHFQICRSDKNSTKKPPNLNVVIA